MTVSPFDSVLFGESLSTPEMREVFEEKSYIEKILQVEVAMAFAEAEVGMIPKEAAEDIARKATLEFIDLEAVGKLAVTTGHYLMAILIPWSRRCGKNGEFIHWGATTQDILDTTYVLLLREAHQLMVRDLEAIKKHLSDLALKHRETPIAGRTHIVHAIPMTFGLKVAIWLDEVNRHLERFLEMKKRLFVGNITGAVGTFASFGDNGPEVQRLTLQRLGLGVPDVCWHAARDRYAEFVSALALTASSLSRIAHQILILMRPEILEIEEPIPPGAIGSSTMPQKKNPVLSEMTIALAKILRGHSLAMSEALETFDERSYGCWFSEFLILPESCLLMSAILKNMKIVLEGLIVHPENMEKNLGLSKGLINAENVMITLAQHVGRQSAHEIIYEDSMKAWQQNRPLEDVLLENDKVTKYFSQKEIRELCNPLTYTGLSSKIVDAIIKKQRAS